MHLGIKTTLFAIGLFLLGGGSALAGWETGAKIGFDSNVNRSIAGNAKGDSFLSAYAGFGREPSGDLRQDWFFSALAEGTAHANVSDLDSLSATLSPGMVFSLRPSWTLSVAPFLQGKSVKDSNQSAMAIGGRISMKQRLEDDLSLGEYYAYTSSHANANVFSYNEHALGLTLGKTFSDRLSGDVGYEYGRGDSYRSEGTSAAFTGMGGFGSGMTQMFSSTFGTNVVRERVTRNTLGASAEYDWTKSLFSAASYAYTVRRGDLGSSTSHTGFAGLGYRF
jgi:hypothetical protein